MFDELRKKTEEYWIIDGNKLHVIDKEYVANLKIYTKFLDETYPNERKLIGRHRMYCALNGIFSVSEIPKCKCGSPVCLDVTNPSMGFRNFCSPECSRTTSHIKKEILDVVNNKEWLHEQLFILGKSAKLVAREVGVSDTFIRKLRNKHELQ